MQTVNMRDDVSAYNYERELAPKDLTKTLMIDYPIGTTIELQLVGGYGSQRVVALSHPHCLIVNGFDNYTRLVLNESNTLNNIGQN